MTNLDRVDAMLNAIIASHKLAYAGPWWVSYETGVNPKFSGVIMTAGPELDALVADKVMGLTVEKTVFGDFVIKMAYVNHVIPHYSTDIVAAWEVVEKLKSQSVVLNYGEDTQGWECSFIVGGKRYTSVRSIITHAICLAALSAVGHEL